MAGVSLSQREAELFGAIWTRRDARYFSPLHCGPNRQNPMFTAKDACKRHEGYNQENLRDEGNHDLWRPAKLSPTHTPT
jgi:hypothetical protein